MGKGGKVTAGYWYNVAYHAGLGIGPFDAFLEFRAGDKTAWAGNLTSSGTININQPNLFGGEKDQGGIVGDVDVMFGEAGQQPNAYLLQTFGNQVPAWQGLGTLVFKGGKYGAMNPYPQKPAYKFSRIVKGWDNDACWYPEKAAVLGPPNTSLDTGSWRYKVSSVSDGTAFYADNYDDSLWLRSAPPFANVYNPVAGSYGYIPTPGTVIPCDPTVYVWMRGTFTLNVLPGSLNFDAFVDNDIEVWINGVHVLTDGSALSHHVSAAISSSSCRLGNNQIAVRLHERAPYTPGNCTYFDCKFIDDGTQPKYMNPAHILYYARTQQDMGREPVSNMHDASFRAAADWYFGQGFSLCTEYDPGAESIDDFISRIERVAGCSMSRSPVDGLWYLDVANGVYDLASLPVLTDDDILDFSESPNLLDSANNSVSVQYFDPEQKESITTAPIQAMALVDAFGTIHNQVSYPEVPISSLAIRLATRDLRAAVTPTHAFELTTTRLTYGWRVGSYFRLQSPKRGIADMVCILAEKSSGTLKSGAIKITASQDIYSLPTTSFVDTEHGVDTRPSQIPVPITAQAAFEAPYIEVCAALSRADLATLPSDAGYLMAVADIPAISRDYTLVVSIGGDYIAEANGDWCATGVVIEASGYDGTHFTLASGVRLSDVTTGTPAIWGSEIVRVDAINAGTGAITLGRSCGDSVPVKHLAGERIWFYATAFAADTTEYTDGETIHAKLLTNTGSQQLAIDAATDMPVLFSSRAARPYPPGQFRINGDIEPSSIIGAVSVTGVHRDRVQQADQLIDSEMAAIGPEAGTTYTARYYINGVLAHTDAGLMTPASTYTPSGAGIIRVEFESVRDGLASYQMHVREFSIGQPLLDESGAPITTEDDQIIIMG